MLTLYHHGSSACAAKVRLALAEKELEWDSRYIDLMKGEQFSPDYLALNPKAVVPTLVHGSDVIPESTVICEYVEDTWPEPALMPRHPLSRARVRLWTKAVDEELHPACSALTYIVSHRHTILRAGTSSFEDFLAAGSTEGRAARERKWQWIQQGLDAPGAADQLHIYAAFIARMDRALEGGPWLAGKEFSLADVAMAPYLYRLETLSMAAIWQDGRLDRVEDWLIRMRERPSFALALERWMPEELGAEMRKNGEIAWPEVASILKIPV